VAAEQCWGSLSSLLLRPSSCSPALAALQQAASQVPQKPIEPTEQAAAAAAAVPIPPPILSAGVLAAPKVKEGGALSDADADAAASRLAAYFSRDDFTGSRLQPQQQERDLEQEQDQDQDQDQEKIEEKGNKLVGFTPAAELLPPSSFATAASSSHPSPPLSVTNLHSTLLSLFSGDAHSIALDLSK
jgi:hypothetical protein